MKIGVYTFYSGKEPKDLKNKIKKLKKQLAIAVEALKCYGQENWTYADEYNYIPWNVYTGGWCHAEKALEQIKELDNER